MAKHVMSKYMDVECGSYSQIPHAKSDNYIKLLYGKMETSVTELCQKCSINTDEKPIQERIQSRDSNLLNKYHSLWAFTKV